ncbi:DUF2637 domain-containing protein [Streptomyces pseudoechinosporeus]
MSARGETPRDESVDLRDAPSNAGAGVGFEVWVRRGCALVVASVAAYASYVHQRAFALQGGADAVSATLWPLSVDGLLLLATVGAAQLGPQRGASGAGCGVAGFPPWYRGLFGGECGGCACVGVEAGVGGGLASGGPAALGGTARAPRRSRGRRECGWSGDGCCRDSARRWADE